MYDEPDPYDEDDPMNPSRGVLNGVALGFVLAVLLFVLVFLSGCASLMPDAIGVQGAHTSHVTARPADEDSLDVAQFYAKWEWLVESKWFDRCETRAAIGARLRERGFFGPTETTTLSTGCEWSTEEWRR